MERDTTYQRVVHFPQVQAPAKSNARAITRAMRTRTKPRSTVAVAAPLVAPVGGVQGVSTQAFGPYAAQALRVAACESRLNPNARNASGASGVFQFLPSTWAVAPYHAASPFNAWANINAAHWLFVHDDYDWREWQCGAA